MRKLLALLLMLLLALAACNLGQDENEEPLATATFTTAPSGRPTVTILSPQSGAEYVVGETVVMSINASDPVGITQVRLLANGQIVRTVSPEPVADGTSRNLLLEYIAPSSPGEVTLRVIAARGTTESDPAEITINVRRDQQQVTATADPGGGGLPTIDPFDPTCRARINVALNFRTGPSTNFAIITTLPVGTVVPVVGRLGDNSWYQVSRSNRVGWVSSGGVDRAFVTLYGQNCIYVPIVAGPATPTPQFPTATPTPTPTPTFTPQVTAPDLDVPAIGPETVTLPAGQPFVEVNIGITVRNRGGAAVNRQFSTDLRINPSASATIVVPPGTVGSLDAGQSVSLTARVQFQAAGIYTLTVTVDSDSEIAEDSETNNIGTVQVEVIAGS